MSTKFIYKRIFKKILDKSLSDVKLYYIDREYRELKGSAVKPNNI
jgi:hypothetical protein